MGWSIINFETSRKEKPIEEFLKRQSGSTKAKIVHNVRLLKQYGNQITAPRSKQLEKNLFELRIRGKQELRILYSFKGRNVLLLHIFKKQTQKTPRKELEVAYKRRKIMIDNV
jgi:phage-related protein